MLNYEEKRLEAIRIASSISNNLPSLKTNADEILDYIDTAPKKEPTSIDHMTEFMENCKIIHPVRGVINPVIYDYLKHSLFTIDMFDKTILLHGRQMHFTSLFALYALYYAMHNNNVTIGYVSIKNAMDTEWMDRIEKSYSTIPNNLRKAVGYRKNKTHIGFDNNSKILTGSWKKLVDNTIDILIIDEAAFISNVEMGNIRHGLFPSVRSDGKIIMGSTLNHYQGEFYQMAFENLGKFQVESYPWFKHPERDDAWRKKVEDALGKDKFILEHECRYPD